MLDWHKWATWSGGGSQNVSDSLPFAMRLPFALAAAASLTALAVPNAAQALTWNWSFTTTNASQYGSGTFTTAGEVPAAGTTYQITGISGTYNRNSSSYAITSLNGTYTNAFRWDGTPTSAINTGFYSWISFYVASGEYVQIANGANSGFLPVTRQGSSFLGNDADVATSLLSPVTPSASVPGPLPLFGAGAAFGWSRRLRRRVKCSAPKAATSIN